MVQLDVLVGQAPSSTVEAEVFGHRRDTGRSRGPGMLKRPDTVNRFADLWALGYQRLVPIIPPGADISANSSLNKRKDARGKAVGVRRHDGDWSGFDWIPYAAEENDCARWHRMGAGVGIKTGQGLIAIDADTLDMTHAAIIRDIIERHCGRLPVRVGNYPKALYLARVSDEYRYTRVEFGERRPDGTLKDRVEILSDKRQFVAFGIHPVTQRPYEWPRELVPYAELPVFAPAVLDALMKELHAALPSAPDIVREGSTNEVNQDALKGKLATIAKAVNNTPNTSDHFPTREKYRDYGYAIKAALPDHPDEAFELYADWCARWTDGENNPDIVEADWRRMKPPYRRGAGWLYELAERYSGGKFTEAEAWFEPIPEDDNPFAEVRAQEMAEKKTDDRTSVYPVLTLDELINRPPPQWLIERYFPSKSVGFVYSDPGAGKTFVILDAGMSIAAGLPDWHGDAIHAPDGGIVLYLAAEGSYGFRNRVKAWMKERSIGAGDLRSFKLIEKTINFMNKEDIDRLLRTIRSVLQGGGSLALVVVDTVSRAMPGADENLQKDMTRFVEACDAVKDTFGCAVVGVHHAGKSGDMRGSTVLRGAGDFVFELTRKKGASMGRLLCEKMKDAPDGWEDAYRFDRVEIEDGESSLVVARGDIGVGPSRSLTPDLAAEVLEAMRAAWEAGEPWSKAPQAKERHAIKRMVADFGFDGVKSEELLMLWEQTGVIEVRTLSAKHRLIGFYVRAEPGQAVQNEGIFG
jgi:hypothetical protein